MRFCMKEPQTSIPNRHEGMHAADALAAPPAKAGSSQPLQDADAAEDHHQAGCAPARGCRAPTRGASCRPLLLQRACRRRRTSPCSPRPSDSGTPAAGQTGETCLGNACTAMMCNISVSGDCPQVITMLLQHGNQLDSGFSAHSNRPRCDGAMQQPPALPNSHVCWIVYLGSNTTKRRAKPTASRGEADLITGTALDNRSDYHALCIANHRHLAHSAACNAGTTGAQ